MGVFAFGGVASVSEKCMEESCSCNRAACFLSSSLELSAGVGAMSDATPEVAATGDSILFSAEGAAIRGVAATTGACGGAIVVVGCGTAGFACVTGRTGFAGLAGSGAPLAVAAGSTTRSDGKRIPQNPTAGSVNSNSTYPLALL